MAETQGMSVDDQLAWSRMLAIVEEQAQTLMRTAFSTVVREAGDLSAGVFDTEGRMLAQAVTGTPGHVNAMAASVEHFLAAVPLAQWRPGDALVTNDPWLGTGHLNDFTVVTPVFHGDRCVALFASTSHIADVGGRGFGADANEVFEEGLNIPIMPLFEQGHVNAVLLNIIRANVRDPVVAEGDLYSLATCNDIGAKQLQRLMDDFGLGELTTLSERILSVSKRAMLDEIASVPAGRYESRMTIDGYDKPLELRCTMRIGAEGIDVDFSGSAPRSDFGINVPLAYTQAYASFGVRAVIGGDVPNNAGSLATIRVSAPAGSLLAAQPPSAVSARHAVGQMLPDVVFGCLHQALPDRVPAEGASCIWNPVLLNAPVDGNEPQVPFVINPIFNGGTGARAGADGLSTTAFPSGVRTTPTEVNEATSPLVIWRREYAVGSGGAGRHRGGLGQTIEIAHRHGAPFYVSKMFDRVGHAARGRAGGEAGDPGRIELDDGTVLRGKGRERVPGGRTLRMITPGGGGYGNPRERADAARDADKIAGLTDAD